MKLVQVQRSLIVWVGVAPLRDSVVVVSIDQVVLDERILQSSQVERSAASFSIPVDYVVFDDEVDPFTIREVILAELLCREFDKSYGPLAGWFFFAVAAKYRDCLSGHEMN